jgi:hypothetical protein
MIRRAEARGITMIKNLFTKRDHRVFAGITKEQAAQAAAWYWRSRQFGISFTSPYGLVGAQYYSRLGLRQQISVWVADESQGVGVDVNLSAELTDEGAVVGVVGAVLVLPVAVVVGAVSYMEHENDAQALMSDFWSYLYNFPKNPVPPEGPAPLPSWAKGQVAEPATATQQVVPAPVAAAVPQGRSCPGCGIPADADAKFCKACGAKL